MKLDTVEQRHKFIDGMIKKSFDIDKLFMHDEENVDDWLSNIAAMTNLIMLERMIRTEKIFIYLFEDVEEFPIESAEKKIYLDMIGSALNHYVEVILCDALEYALDSLDSWQFNTPTGKRFRKNTDKKLKELLDKYHKSYGLVEEDNEQNSPLKFDTSHDRLEVVLKFFKRGIKLSDEFKSDERPNFSEVMAMMATLEKLTALEDAIRTEIFFEDAINDMLDVKDEPTETRNKFFAPFAQQSEQFMKNILVKRIEQIINFTGNSLIDERITNFFAELSEAMITLRKKYAEIYLV